ncbi:MAG: ribosomal protein S18-alanine N-acetyltransferase [Anaerolineales bacterium]|nr:ribosomal protein S18-alanine N-acetyltransferase [Anaerolineales bacterium]
MTQPIPFKITPLTIDDLSAAAAIETAAYATHPPQRDYRRELNSHLAHYLALRVLFTTLYDSLSDASLAKLIGVAGFWLLADEIHVVTIAVEPHWKGLGLGEWLFIALLEAGQAAGGQIATLEVRPSNQPALSLYRKYGFEETGRRKAYYNDNEDALILTTPLLAAPAYQAFLAAQKTAVHLRLSKITLDDSSLPPI